MPELPEVEVTRRRIEPLLVGRRIAEVRTSKPSYFFITPPARLRAGLVGRSVRALERRGTYSLAELDDAKRLVLHLGMTGQLFSSAAASVRLLSSARRASLAPEEQPTFVPDEHTHLELRFADGEPTVRFRDVRKFGKVLLLDAGATDQRLERLGRDALGATAADLYTAARKRRVAIKSLLLDQSVLAGVGNIYADEALFLASVRPTRQAGRVSLRECDAIMTALHGVLERSIETGGSSISDYVAPDGEDGGYQNERRVYGRKGEPCPRCSASITRIVLGQRAAHYCRRCQK
jgi:formamidopyrimidine-DNA glycosylase